MKKIYILLIAAAVMLNFTACSEDKPGGESIFPTNPTTQYDKFEQWLLENFTYPYNIEVLYRMKDIEIDHKYTLTPADSAKCAKLAIIVKYLWFDAYAEVAGPDFVKVNVPRTLQFIGSLAMESNGTVVMGTAEGGYKITLYNVNNLGVADGGYGVPLDDYDALNKWYFTTLHHEFQHILNQKKPYDTTFDLISEGDYVSGDWYQYNTNTQALPKGFIRNYAMVEPREDYAELYSQYLTNNDELWASKMDKTVQYTYEGLSKTYNQSEERFNPLTKTYIGKPSAETLKADFVTLKIEEISGQYKVTGYSSKTGKALTKTYNTYPSNKVLIDDDFELSNPTLKTIDTYGQDIINAKLAHIRNYMRENWNIDLEEMRACVLRRSAEYMKLDFEHLN